MAQVYQTYLIFPRRAWTFCISAGLQKRPLSSKAALPYRVIRNSRGSLPVYTDVRNGGTRHFVLVRNIEGNANAMLQDLRASLFPDKTVLVQGEVIRSKHLKLRAFGPGWKTSVEDWLKLQGF